MEKTMENLRRQFESEIKNLEISEEELLTVKLVTQKFRKKASIDGRGVKDNPIIHPNNFIFDCDCGIYDDISTLFGEHKLFC